MRIDLNADVGESFGQWSLGDDAELIPLLSSANIACGFHAGDAVTMQATLDLAKRSQVAVGAHVAYRDLAGFGRRFLDVDPAELRAEVMYQIGAFTGLARAAGLTVGYVKPHGALYNTIVKHEAQGRAVVEAIVAIDPGLTLLGLPSARVLDLAADAGLTTAAEAFCDRGYTAEGTLVPRSRPGAVLSDAAEVAARVVRMVTDGVVTADDGSEVEMRADSVCVHGDSPGAVDMARAVRAALDAEGVDIRPFTDAAA